MGRSRLSLRNRPAAAVEIACGSTDASSKVIESGMPATVISFTKVYHWNPELAGSPVPRQ